MKNILFLIIFTIILFLIIYVISGRQTVNSTINAPPSQSRNVVSCKSVKTICDPTDSSSCANLCSEVDMICQPTNTDKNYVCLPKKPDLICDENKGGVYSWSGYGFSEKQDWSCLCTHPEYFNGPGCIEPTTTFCTGGKVNIDKGINDNSCTCEPGKIKLYRQYGGTPFCVDNDPNLIGNMIKYPNWENIFMNPDPNDKIYDKWSKKIAKELNPFFDTLLPGQIQEILTKNNNSSITLTKATVDELCKLKQPNLCESNSFKPEEYKAKVMYTYYDNDYLANF